MRHGRLAKVLLSAVVAAVVVVTTGAATARRFASCPSAVAGERDLGRLAFIDGDQLRVVVLASCRVTTLVGSGVAPPVRWSADGRYIAYGSGAVVAAKGGTPSEPLGRLEPGWGSGSPGWLWSPHGHRLAGVTVGGGVVIGGPGERSVRLWPDRWGATSIAWSPDGRTLAVSRSRYLKAPAPYHQQIWLLNLASGKRTLLWHLRRPDVAPAQLSGFSPDGRWLLTWEDSQNSASLAADGVPLVLIPTHGGGTGVTLGPELIYGDFVSWCGPNELAYVLDNGGREVTMNDRINVAGPPPSWPTDTPADPGRAAHLSFISPACASVDGEPAIAVAAGPATTDEPFGHEHRSIRLLLSGGDWQSLEAPPPRGSSDELPMWSSDHHWIAFIRTTARSSGYSGRLYLLALGPHFDGHARRIGPIAALNESGGYTGDYYGYYGWAARVAWYSR